MHAASYPDGQTNRENAQLVPSLVVIAYVVHAVWPPYLSLSDVPMQSPVLPTRITLLFTRTLPASLLAFADDRRSSVPPFRSQPRPPAFHEPVEQSESTFLRISSYHPLV